MRRVIPLPFGTRLILDVESGAAEQKYRTIQERLQDRKKLPCVVANAMRADIRGQFAVGGDLPWTPLAPSTIKRRQALGYPRRTPKGSIPRRLLQNGQFDAANILIMAGRLRDSRGRSDHRENVEKRDERAVEVEMVSKVPRTAFQQGIATFGGILPRRPGRTTAKGVQAMAQAYASYLLTNNSASAYTE